MVTPQPLPKHVVAEFANSSNQMAISSFDIDIVQRRDDGTEERVPLYDAYLHHYILHIGEATGLSDLYASQLDANSMLPSKLQRWLNERDAGDYVSFGGAAGAEYRHNPHNFEAPFRLLLTRPTTWAPTLHIINTKQPYSDEPYSGEPSPLLQCPCTPQRVIDADAGTIDGHEPYPAFACDESFLEAANPSCSLKTYTGGWRCCEDGVFVIDTRQCKGQNCKDEPQATWYVKMSFTYESVPAGSTAVRPLEATACCDVTSTRQGDGNVEYDVPQCAAGTPPDECIHVTSSIQPLAHYSADAEQGVDGRALVALNYAAAHLHLGGISLSLEDALTNETICKVSTADHSVSYGESTRAGDEENYLTGLRPCVWGGDTAKRFERQHPMRTVAVYNASQTLTGVMALWLMTSANVRDEPACDAKLREAGCLGQSTSSACRLCAESHAAELYGAGCQRDMAIALCDIQVASVAY